MRIKLIIEYDGTNYYGFQHQDSKNSIEDELIKAICSIDKDVTKVYGSGRTDRFVHAKGQVVHFDTLKDIEEYKWCKSINSFLPDDIKVLSVSKVGDDFHSRFSVKQKKYSYFIKINDFSVFDRNYFFYQGNLDVSLMDLSIKELIGTYDFRGFCSAKINELKDTKRTIYNAQIIRYNNYIELKFCGDGFLRYQIRKMVGSLIDVGLGNLSNDEFRNILLSKDPKLSNKTAQPQGLYLIEVLY